MAQAKEAKSESHQCDLEDEILSHINSSCIAAIQGAGKSFINPWCPLHFTRGKYSDHMTIQESTLQCIHAFLNFAYSSNHQIQLFYEWTKANPRQRSKALMQQIVRSVDKNCKLMRNVHFNAPTDYDESAGTTGCEKAGMFGYECRNMQTMASIKAESTKVHQVLRKLNAKYFVDLKENHNIDFNALHVNVWSS